jgi:predicted dehydrogenase
MVKQARHMVRQGMLGEIRKVLVEYSQSWLLTKLEDTGHKQAGWRTDPARAGLGGAVGDIGTHAENLMSTITGLELEAICADLTSFLPGRLLDDDAMVLLRFTNGAKGFLTASQVSAGCENNLSIRVLGSQAGLTWYQEHPNYLTYAPADEPVQTLSRGNDYLCAAAQRAARMPWGHPEAFAEAFANVYLNATDTMRAKILGLEPTDLELDFPSVYDGARGVFFVERVVESNMSDRKWTPARWNRDRSAPPTPPVL